MSDRQYSSLRFRIFNVLSLFKRESLAIEIDAFVHARRLAQVLEYLKVEPYYRAA
jgi:hypothetical protein|tara:strand:+ start:3958 stop:4122 length:165 start_codon:yes stop_codon:yes gene_type:complete